MTPQSTLEAVRNLSENAPLRPALARLRLTRPGDLRAGPRPAVTTYEELHPPRIGSWTPHQSGKRQATDHCATCGKRPEYCYCEVKPKEKDFMREALEKSAAAIERLPFVMPAARF